MTRAEWLLGTAKRSDHILEIGPSYSPIAPKAAGWRTHVVDHASQDELREKYRPMGVDITRIEAVDAVWAGGGLHEALPADCAGRFARLIASHVIEHIPNLIGFLVSAAQLLTPSGTVALAVPDMRHCFDFFKPMTTTGDVLEANSLKRSRHSLRTVWNQNAYSVNWHGVGVWGGAPVEAPVEALAFVDSFASAARAHASYSDDPAAPYVDCHAWQFVPSRFRLVALELGQLGMIDFHVAAIEQMGAEFLCTLRRGVERLDGASLQRLRMDLLYSGLEETRAQIEMALGASGGKGRRAAPDWGGTAMLRRS